MTGPSSVGKIRPILGSEHRPLYVMMEVNEIPVKMLVDTGADITIINPRIFERIPRCYRPRLEEHPNVNVADGRPMRSLGKGTFHLLVSGMYLVHEVYVATIDVDGLLGSDFLSKYKCQIDLGRRTITFSTEPDPEIELNIQQEIDRPPTKCYVVVAETVTIPEGGEMMVPGSLMIPNGIPEEGYDVHVLPDGKFIEKHGVLVTDSIIRTEQGRIPLRVLNVNGKPVRLYKGSVAATCEPIAEVRTVEAAKTAAEDAPCESKGDAGVVPAHLEDLYFRCAENLSQSQAAKLAECLQENADVFAMSPNDVGRTGLVKHKINTGTSRPIKQRPRRLPLQQREDERALVQEMLDRKVITPSSSPWASPIVLVKKKDGTWRFCVDYRKLNEVTIKDSFGVARIDDSLDTLGGAKWFSTLDLQSGYWQVEMDEDSKEKTAFITSTSGLYQFERMPFGLCNSPATFERLMEQVLTGLHWEICLVYLDDIIVYGTSFEDQLERLKSVFGRLRYANLKLSPKKCNLFKKEVSYLGHVVSRNGIAPDPGKIRSIQTWPQPTTVTEVRSFLGLCSYYRRFIQSFSAIAKPLHQLTEKNRKFEWTEECEEAFYLLKTKLMSAPILAYPNSSDPYILDTDASQFGVGAVLSQLQQGEEKVVAYYSRTLTKPERRYCVTRKELLAIVQGVKQFHHYIYGTEFTVRTDHNALKWLMRFKYPSGQTARWLEVLGTYRGQNARVS